MADLTRARLAIRDMRNLVGARFDMFDARSLIYFMRVNSAARKHNGRYDTQAICKASAAFATCTGAGEQGLNLIFGFKILLCDFGFSNSKILSF